MSETATDADARIARLTDVIAGYEAALDALDTAGYDSTDSMRGDIKRRKRAAETATHDVVRESDHDKLISELYQTILYGSYGSDRTLADVLTTLVSHLRVVEAGDTDEDADTDATRGDTYDAARVDDHGNDPAYAPFGAGEEDGVCGECGAAALRFVGGAPLPGWTGTPAGDRELYECRACGAGGKLMSRGTRALTRTGACAPPAPDDEPDSADHDVRADGGRDGPHDGESHADYLAGHL